MWRSNHPAHHPHDPYHRLQFLLKSDRTSTTPVTIDATGGRRADVRNTCALQPPEAPLIVRDIQLAAMGALDRLCTFSTT